MPNAWDAGSALLLESAGFEAVGTTSAGIAYALGRADATGALSIDEALDETARIAGAVSVPVNVDAENGYGASPEAVAVCIRRCIDAGAVGAGIEDYTWDSSRTRSTTAPWRSSASAPPARRWMHQDVPFVLTARAECYLYRRSGRLRRIRRPIEPLPRGRRRPAVHPRGPKDRDEVVALVREIDGPMNFVVGKGMADYTLEELRRARHPQGEHRGVADARRVRTSPERAVAEMKDAGPLHLGRGSAQPRETSTGSSRTAARG